MDKIIDGRVEMDHNKNTYNYSLGVMKKIKWFLFLFSFVLFLAPAMSHAQAQSYSPPIGRLLNISISSVNVNENSNTISGSFDVSSQENFAVPGIKYALLYYEGNFNDSSSFGTSPILLDEQSGGSFNIQANGTKTVKFSFTPKFSAPYENTLTIQLYDPDYNFIFQYNTLISLPSVQSPSYIIAPNSVMVYNGLNSFGSSDSPQFDLNTIASSMAVSFDIENTGIAGNVKLKTDTYSDNFPNLVSSNVLSSANTIPAGSIDNYKYLPYDSGVKNPGQYLVNMYLVDAQNPNVVLSNIASFRYIITGGNFVINSASFNKSSYKKGDSIWMDVNYTGYPYATSAIYQMKIQLFNNDNLVSAYSQNINSLPIAQGLSFEYGKAPFDIANPKAVISIYNGNNELATYTLISNAGLSKKNMVFTIAAVLTLIILALLYFLFKKMKKNKAVENGKKEQQIEGFISIKTILSVLSAILLLFAIGGASITQKAFAGWWSAISPYSTGTSRTPVGTYSLNINGTTYNNAANEFSVDGSTNGGTVSSVNANSAAGRALLSAGFQQSNGQVKISSYEASVGNAAIPSGSRVSYNGQDIASGRGVVSVTTTTSRNSGNSGGGSNWTPTRGGGGSNWTPNNPPIQAVIPTVNISVSPSSIYVGSSSVLSWRSSNATSCVGTGGWSGYQSISGALNVSPASTTTYSLTCYSSTNNQTSSSATLTVTPLTYALGVASNFGGMQIPGTVSGGTPYPYTPYQIIQNNQFTTTLSAPSITAFNGGLYVFSQWSNQGSDNMVNLGQVGSNNQTQVSVITGTEGLSSSCPKVTADYNSFYFNINPQASTSSSIAGKAISFMANPSTNIPAYLPSVQYQWNFGDGATSALENPTHSYNKISTFNVTLTATNVDAGQKLGSPVVATASVPIKIQYQQPVYREN